MKFSPIEVLAGETIIEISRVCECGKDDALFFKTGSGKHYKLGGVSSTGSDAAELQDWTSNFEDVLGYKILHASESHTSGQNSYNEYVTWNVHTIISAATCLVLVWENVGGTETSLAHLYELEDNYDIPLCTEIWHVR